MSLITTLGLVAGALTTIAFVPQVVHAWRTRCTRDISLAMLLVLGAGVSLWIVFGVLTASLPIVAANALTLILIAAILVAKAKYG
jgi:MtN3 and saliva related transmembrane protein